MRSPSSNFHLNMKSFQEMKTGSGVGEQAGEPLPESWGHLSEASAGETNSIVSDLP